MVSSSKKADPKSPFRIQQDEKSLQSIPLWTLNPGDVFVREGTAHMVCNPAENIAQTRTETDHMLIINLTNGSTWWISSDLDNIWPATEVKLSYRTIRRG